MASTNKQTLIQAYTKVLLEEAGVQKRKNDTRRKILTGCYIINKHERAGATEILLADLNSFLTKKQDRELFGLPFEIEITHKNLRD